MMNFMMMTASFTVAIVLASLIMFVTLLNKPVLKWYMKYATKLSEEIVSELFVDSEENKDL